MIPMTLQFNIKDITKRVEPSSLKTVWSGILITPLGEELAFEKTGSKPTVSSAAKAAGIKIQVSLVEKGHFVTRDIELGELQKQKQGAIVKYNGKVLGVVPACKTGSKQ
jgi:hypothetical protein